jgi:hypothetical protein
LHSDPNSHCIAVTCPLSDGEKYARYIPVHKARMRLVLHWIDSIPRDRVDIMRTQIHEIGTSQRDKVHTAAGHSTHGLFKTHFGSVKQLQDTFLWDLYKPDWHDSQLLERSSLRVPLGHGMHMLKRHSSCNYEKHYTMDPDIRSFHTSLRCSGCRY